MCWELHGACVTIGVGDPGSVWPELLGPLSLVVPLGHSQCLRVGRVPCGSDSSPQRLLLSCPGERPARPQGSSEDRKSTRLNSSH